MESKAISSTIEVSHNKLWSHHARVSDQISQYFLETGSKRVIASINQCEPFQCALTAYRKGIYVVKVNQTLRKKLSLNEGSQVTITLKKDESKYGLSFPEELKEVLAQDSPGDKLFHDPTRGKQRALLYIINQGKTPDQRVTRSLTIVDHLKIHNGKIDDKILNQSIRDLQNY